jgi:hypothetical protein
MPSVFGHYMIGVLIRITPWGIEKITFGHHDFNFGEFSIGFGSHPLLPTIP